MFTAVSVGFAQIYDAACNGVTIEPFTCSDVLSRYAKSWLRLADDVLLHRKLPP